MSSQRKGVPESRGGSIPAWVGGNAALQKLHRADSLQIDVFRLEVLSFPSSPGRISYSSKEVIVFYSGPHCSLSPSLQ